MYRIEAENETAALKKVLVDLYDKVGGDRFEDAVLDAMSTSRSFPAVTLASTLRFQRMVEAEKEREQNRTDAEVDAEAERIAEAAATRFRNTFIGM